MCLLHLLASHFVLAADLPSEIPLAVLEDEVYGCPITVSALVSQARCA